MDGVFDGLKPLPLKFPRKCNNCGREYANEAEFLQQTQALRSDRSPLKEAEGEDGETIVEVFRNCVCGSTLMDEFQSRRDDTPEGRSRRDAWARAHSRSSGNAKNPG